MSVILKRLPLGLGGLIILNHCLAGPSWVGIIEACREILTYVMLQLKPIKK